MVCRDPLRGDEHETDDQKARPESGKLVIIAKPRDQQQSDAGGNHQAVYQKQQARHSQATGVGDGIWMMHDSDKHLVLGPVAPASPGARRSKECGPDSIGVMNAPFRRAIGRWSRAGNLREGEKSASLVFSIHTPILPATDLETQWGLHPTRRSRKPTARTRIVSCSVLHRLLFLVDGLAGFPMITGIRPWLLVFRRTSGSVVEHHEDREMVGADVGKAAEFDE